VAYISFLLVNRPSLNRDSLLLRQLYEWKQLTESQAHIKADVLACLGPSGFAQLFGIKIERKIKSLIECKKAKNAPCATSKNPLCFVNTDS